MFNQYQPFINYGVPSKFSFTTLLNGAQKTLNIVNQALPIVKEVKPLVKNAKTFINVAKGFSKINNSEPSNVINNDTKKSSNNGPNFFI